MENFYKKCFLHLLILCLVLGTTATVSAQGVYRVVDENGNVTYTDNPGDKPAEKVEAQEPNVVQGTTPVIRPQPSPIDGDVPKKYKVKIVQPESEAHLNADQRELTISVSTDPALHEKHRVQIVDNGAAQDISGTSLTVKNLNRGTHSYVAQVVNEKGKVLGTSGTVTVYVHHPATGTPRPSPR